MNRTIYTQPYINGKFNYFCPAVKLKISNWVSLEETEIIASLDTGFDGEILIPWKTYKKLNLKNSQLQEVFPKLRETISGEVKKMLSSPAKVEFGHLTLYPTVETFEDNKKAVIGRGFIEEFTTILNGLEKILIIKENQEH